MIRQGRNNFMCPLCALVHLTIDFNVLHEGNMRFDMIQPVPENHWKGCLHAIKSVVILIHYQELIDAIENWERFFADLL